jgi:hypothetical protein
LPNYDELPSQSELPNCSGLSSNDEFPSYRESTNSPQLQ